MALFDPGVIPALDSDGNPISGATWYFYYTGTTTPLTVYSDGGIVTPLGSSVNSDAAGRFADIYLSDSIVYRAILKDAGGATIKDIDPVNAVEVDFYIKNVKDYGATGDGTTDDTAAIQAAFTALSAGTIGSLFFPDGTYKITASITASASVMIGWHVFGQSRAKTIIKQYTANTPHFSFTVTDMHTIDWHTMRFEWNGAQTGNTNAVAFKFLNGGGSKSIYNSRFSDLLFIGAYYAIDASGALFWGNEVSNCWSTDAVGGGGLKINGSAGQPNNFIQMRVKIVPGGGANVPAFHCSAVYATWHVEVLGHPGGVIHDAGGGAHTILYASAEGGSYPSGNTFLFDFINSKLNISVVTLLSLTLQASAQVFGFRTEGSTGFLSGKRASVTFSGGIAAQGAGSSFYLFGGGNAAFNSLMEFDALNMSFSAVGASPVSALTNVGASGTADYCRIRSWVDPERTVRMDDANLTLAYDGPMVVAVGKPLTATRKIILPYGDSGNGNNLFGGWRRRIMVLPSQTGVFAIDVRNSADTVTYGTIPAGVQGVWEIRWDRANLNLAGGGVGNWTFTYLGPVEGPASTTEVLTGTNISKPVTADALAALWEQAADVASAGTVTLGDGGYFNITGTTTITDIDFTTDKTGRTAKLKFAAALTLTNGAALILPTGANIVTRAGDVAEFVSEGSDVVRCIRYQRADGTNLIHGYAAGDGGTVTQITSRTTGVTLNELCGQITLFSAAGSASYTSFTVTNSTVGVNDTVTINQKSGTDRYIILITDVAAGSFEVTFATTGGTTTEQPVFTFSVTKGVVT